MRRVIRPLLALAVLLPSMAFARTMFLCDVDLVVRDSCCCPPKEAKRPIDAPMLHPECCTIEQRSSLTAPFATAASPQPLPAPLATFVESTIVIPPLREPHRLVVPRAQAPPLERSLFSQRCSLLV